MIFIRLWDAFVAKKAGLGDPNTNLELTSSQLKKMLWQAYSNGKRLGWIETTGRMLQSRIPRRHRKITEWRSLILETGS